MDFIKLYQKYVVHINFVLILCIIGYLVLQKMSVIEGFDAQTIDFTALNNIANVCKGLNDTGKHIFPGDLEIKGKLIVGGESNLQGDLKAGGVIEGKKNIITNENFMLTNVTGHIYFQDNRNKIGQSPQHGNRLYAQDVYGDWNDIADDDT